MTQEIELSTKNFSAHEFRCKCGSCNKQEPHHCTPELLERLQELRDLYGRPMHLTSGYRCEKHPVEARKTVPGQHNKGTAVDITYSSGREARTIMKLAFDLDFKCVVLGRGFIHVDLREGPGTTWIY